METAETVVRDLLMSAGIEVGGRGPTDIRVHDPRFFARVLSGGPLGLGESYMDGWWDCECLDGFIERVLRSSLDTRVRGNWKVALHVLMSRLFNLQTLSRSRKVAEVHYDLGNDFFQAMLGPTLQYTCAYWRGRNDLDSAQEAKMDLVCRKLGLRPGMRVLELGCGWGTFARYAAQRYGVEVTAYNISREQVTWAQEAAQDLPVRFVHDDYRRAEGVYDAVVSIGILEHVGYKNYRTYMEVVSRCLKPDGVSLLHTIGGNVSTTTADAWITKYIFPHGMIPSLKQVSGAMEGLFVLEDLHNFGPDYDRTLMAWHANFVARWPEFRERFGDRFHRMWTYYLLSCAGAFRARHLQLWQIVMTHPGTKQPERIT